MIITQLNTSDSGGGAEHIAFDLHRALSELGHVSSMVVGVKRTDDPAVIEIPRSRASLSVKVRRRIENALGREDFVFPGSHGILGLLSKAPDVIHAHNLHARYFDLRALPALSHALPVVLTLHDAWLLSGHCAHSFECERWRTGCGSCPDLTIYPSVARDGTAFNWRRKKRIFAASRLYAVAPCEWLMNRARESVLGPALRVARVIPNGINLDVFSPGSKAEARRKLGIPADAAVVTSSVPYGEKNIWRDFPGTMSALGEIAADESLPPVCFLALGMEGPRAERGKLTIVPVPHVSDRTRLAEYYRASDIFLHAARADTFPTVVLEALASGVPVVTTAVGGIPEQIVDGDSGLMVPAGDVRALSRAAVSLLADNQRRESIARAARQTAEARFDRRRMVGDYIALYEEILRVHAHVQK